jgi:hypothetical protein
LRHPVSVRQIVRVDADIVRLRVLNKADSFDLATPLEEGFADAMHPIHDAAVAGQDNRKFEVTFKHQARVADYLAAGQFLRRFSSPIWFIEFGDCRKGNAHAGKRARELDEALNIPCAQPCRRIPKMILSPHRVPVLMLG